MPRSPALVLDSETKEPLPRCLPASAHRYEPWKVVVVDVETGKRRSKNYFSYQKAKSIAQGLKEKYGITMWVGVVSRQMGYGPPYSKITDLQLLDQNEMGNYWCPYHRGFSRFLYNAWRERHMCEFCGVVDTDFHVRACNPVYWDPDKLKRMKENANAV